MSEVIPFYSDHFWAMELRAEELDWLSCVPNAEQYIEMLSAHGAGYSLIDGHRVVACFGFFPLWPGVISAWAYPSVYIKRYAVLYLRVVRRCLQVEELKGSLKRMQTFTLDDEHHNKWMRFLGFTCETPDGMKKYSPLGETCKLWSKVYGECE